MVYSISGRIRMQFLCKTPLNGYYESRFSLIGLRSVFENPWRDGSVKAITSLTPANGAARLLLATPASSPASTSSKYWVQWCHCNSALSVQKSTMKSASKAICINSNLCDPTISFIRVDVLQAVLMLPEGGKSQTRCTAAQHLSNEERNWSFTVSLGHPLPSCICDAALLSPASHCEH